MFVGTDGIGTHAKIYIDDKESRIHLGFESDNSTQNVIDQEAINKILAIKTQKSFEDNVKKSVKSDAEKAQLFEIAKSAGINDHSKIKFIEEYTGFKFDA